MARWFKKLVHPKRIAREKEKEAEDQRKEVEKQAAAQAAAVEKHKKEALETISVAYGEAKDQVNAWYKTEFCQAEEDYAKKQADYQKTFEACLRAILEAKDKIESGFHQQNDKLIENQKEDERRLQACRAAIIKQAEQAKANYRQDKLSLDDLWKQAKNAMLHKQCQESYFILKQPGEKLDKSSHYGMLVAYFQHLSSQDFFTNSDLERYIKFVKHLYLTDKISENDESLSSIDKEIHLLFSRSEAKSINSLTMAYKSDYQNSKKMYASSKDVNDALSQKLDTEKQAISDEYTATMNALIEEREEKRRILRNNSGKFLADIESEKALYQEKYDAYVLSLGRNKEACLLEISKNEQLEMDKVNAQCQAELTHLQEEVRAAINKINEALSQNLKQIKRSRLSIIANFFISVVTGVGAYFTGGLLAGASASIVETVRASLGLTSLAAASSLLTGKDKIGFKISVDLNAPRSSGNTNPSRNDRNMADHKGTDDLRVNLKSIRDKFNDFSKDIEEWKSQAEHHFFYSLSKNLGLPELDFSESTVFVKQKPSASFHVWLGASNSYGLRTVDWQAGRAVMFDCDIRMIFKRFTGVNDTVFGKDWQQPQILRFDQRAVKRMKDSLPQDKYFFSGKNGWKTDRKKGRSVIILNYSVPGEDNSLLAEGFLNFGALAEDLEFIPKSNDENLEGFLLKTRVFKVHFMEKENGIPSCLRLVKKVEKSGRNWITKIGVIIKMQKQVEERALSRNNSSNPRYFREMYQPQY